MCNPHPNPKFLKVKQVVLETIFIQFSIICPISLESQQILAKVGILDKMSWVGQCNIASFIYVPPKDQFVEGIEFP